MRKNMPRISSEFDPKDSKNISEQLDKMNGGTLARMDAEDAREKTEKELMDSNFTKILKQIEQSDPNLKILDLTDRKKWPKIESDEAEKLANALKKNHTITSIGIGFHGMRDGRIKKIIDAIKDSKTLVSLDIRMNHISDGQYLVDAFQNNHTLKTLLCDGNKMSSEKISELNKIIERNNTKDERSPAAIVAANFIAQVSKDVAENLIKKEGGGFASKARSSNSSEGASHP